MSKKLLLTLLFSLLLPLILCSKVNAATLNKAIITGPSSIDLYDNTKSVTATGKDRSNKVIPNNKLKITFSSSNTNIATVNATTGKITTKKLGKVTITAKIKKGLLITKSAKLNINIVPKKLSDSGKVKITETTKTISNKWNESNPYLKTSNKTWCLNFNDYNGVSKKSNGTSYKNGAVALYTIQGIRGMSPKEKYLKSSTKQNSTYYVEKQGTNFKIIGYKYAPSYDTYQKFLQAIYNEILAGYPVAINVYNSANQNIYVVGYAVNSTSIRTKGKLSANDIYVIDTSAGQWKKLSDFREYKVNGKYVLGIHDPSSPNFTKKSFAEIAAECYNYFNTNKFSYGNGNAIPYPNDTKKVDCSAFVSWALYKYGYTKDLKGNTFKWQMNVTGIDNFCEAKGFKKIENLSEVKAGDILIWKAPHCEIVKIDGNYKDTYNCGTTEAIRNAKRGGYGYSVQPSYAYRVP